MVKEFKSEKYDCKDLFRRVRVNGYLAEDLLRPSRGEGQGTTMTTRGRQQLNLRNDLTENSPDTTTNAAC